MRSDSNTLKSFPKKNVRQNEGNGGGNSGCVISPAPKLGLSAYQDPNITVKPNLPFRQGGS
jgi:hypothetical protein